MTPYIDFHCDTLMQAFLARKQDIYSFPQAMTDVERLKKGGCQSQFFAIFMAPLSYKAKLGPLLPVDDDYIAALRNTLLNTVQAHPADIALASSLQELKDNRAAGRLSAFLTVEDGRAAEGKLEKLQQWYEMGIRLVSLTWNNENCFGFPNADDPALMQKGLTDFGKEAVGYMNGLGMVIDVSHLSDGGFWDVARLSKKPFIASHSNARALSPHRRNLTDEMIRCLGDKGGVAGLNFGPEFLNASAEDRRSAVSRIAAHAKHLAKVGGMGCVAIGTDFDGIHGELEIPGAEHMQLLFGGLKEAGFTESEIDGIAFKNAERALSDIL